jgi:hypothetical protein
MRVSVGWSTDYAHDKFIVDITEDDWADICFGLAPEAGLPSEEFAKWVTLDQKFWLMKAEAQRLSKSEALAYSLITPQQWSEFLAEYTNTRSALAQSIATRAQA